MGFGFEDAPLADGRSRKMGSDPHDIATLELIGPASNLTQVTLVISNDGAEPELKALYSLLLFSNIVPDWDGGLEWFSRYTADH